LITFTLKKPFIQIVDEEFKKKTTSEN